MTELLQNWHILGLVIGACTFLTIGIFHPIVIKAHYYFGTGCWWWFLIGGLASCAASIMVSNVLLASLLGVLAFSAFWSIGEIFQQEKRVARGWFPANPRRKKPQKDGTGPR